MTQHGGDCWAISPGLILCDTRYCEHAAKFKELAAVLPCGDYLKHNRASRYQLVAATVTPEVLHPSRIARHHPNAIAASSRFTQRTSLDATRVTTVAALYGLWSIRVRHSIAALRTSRLSLKLSEQDQEGGGSS